MTLSTRQAFKQAWWIAVPIPEQRRQAGSCSFLTSTAPFASGPEANGAQFSFARIHGAQERDQGGAITGVLDIERVRSTCAALTVQQSVETRYRIVM